MLDENLRVVVLQRVCFSYRVHLFKRLSEILGSEFILFFGEDIPDSKVKSAKNLNGINHKKLKTRFFKLGDRTLIWHRGLITELKKFKPDVIICEGESHFLGYIQAIIFRYLYNQRVALVYWSLISLPGWPSVEGNRWRAPIKRFFRKFFDAFLVYSTYAKENLLKMGYPSEKIFVATNVGNVEQYINISNSIRESAPEARTKMGLPEKFTVLYVGTLDNVKRPDLILDLARLCESENYNFVLAGTGPLFDGLKQRVQQENLTNVYLLGRVVKKLPLLFKSADVLVVPGRGGIVISEAMAMGLPVVVYQADGTEYDLVQNGITGIRLSNGTPREFCEALETLRSSPAMRTKMGLRAQNLVEKRFTTDNMVQKVLQAARYAWKSRAEKIQKQVFPFHSSREGN